VHGVVAADGSRALFALIQLTTSASTVPEPARLPGLDPARRYRVSAAFPAGVPEGTQHAPPAWLAAGAELPGVALAELGLPMPVLYPEQALLLTATAI
jgi:alpha-galactosidase